MNHKITVLMSVYNGEQWLSPAIESVLSQTFDDFELLIVNDGSTDASASIIRNYEKKDSRVRHFSKMNTGLADSLNCGIREARGEWIARLDADDISHSDRIKLQYSEIKSNSNLVLVGTGLSLINEFGDVYKSHIYPSTHNRLLLALSQGGPTFPHSSAFFRRDLALKIGGYRKRIKRAEDRDLWLRFAREGLISCIPMPLVQIRKHDSQISNDEGGVRQIVDSFISMIAYWLCEMKYKDPVDALDDADFDMFAKWVQSELDATKLFEVVKFKEEYKKQTIHMGSYLDRFLLLAGMAANDLSVFYRVLFEKFASSNLPKKLCIKLADTNYLNISTRLS
ncbi:MAG: glycosyltransferase family 2 protein [Limnohabitans sp.]